MEEINSETIIVLIPKSRAQEISDDEAPKRKVVIKKEPSHGMAPPGGFPGGYGGRQVLKDGHNIKFVKGDDYSRKVKILPYLLPRRDLLMKMKPRMGTQRALVAEKKGTMKNVSGSISQAIHRATQKESLDGCHDVGEAKQEAQVQQHHAHQLLQLEKLLGEDIPEEVAAFYESKGKGKQSARSLRSRVPRGGDENGKGDDNEREKEEDGDEGMGQGEEEPPELDTIIEEEESTTEHPSSTATPAATSTATPAATVPSGYTQTAQTHHYGCGDSDAELGRRCN
eukprot:s1047_g13.t1